MEYVTCKTCRSGDTELSKGENRLNFLTYEQPQQIEEQDANSITDATVVEVEDRSLLSSPGLQHKLGNGRGSVRSASPLANIFKLYSIISTINGYPKQSGNHPCKFQHGTKGQSNFNISIKP